MDTGDGINANDGSVTTAGEGDAPLPMAGDVAGANDGGAFDLLKREVDAIQIKLLSSSAPWYRQPSVLISLAAFLFSFGTTIISSRRAGEQDRHAWRQELRELIVQIVELPLKNAEMVDKYKDNAFMAGSISAMMNEESGILADQAVAVIRKIPENVTAKEYLTVARAFYNGGLVDSARDMRQKAVQIASSPIERAVALRELGAMEFQRGDRKAARETFQAAVDAFSVSPKGQLADPGVVAFFTCFTEMYWAQQESLIEDCTAFAEHVTRAKKAAGSVPPASREIVLTQLNQTESWGCPYRSAQRAGLSPGGDSPPVLGLRPPILSPELPRGSE